jgi:hypothetical protein
MVGVKYRYYPVQTQKYDKKNYTAIPYRASTGPVQGFPCVLFPHREKPVFITGFPGDENRVFPFGKSTQGKVCSVGSIEVGSSHEMFI